MLRVMIRLILNFDRGYSRIFDGFLIFFSEVRLQTLGGIFLLKIFSGN